MSEYYVYSSKASDSDFSLDTEGFDMVINESKRIAETVRDLRSKMDMAKADLMFSWAGKGANTFEKKYRILSQQFEDLKDSFYDIYESLLEIEEAYIQADTEYSKALDGKDSRY